MKQKLKQGKHIYINVECNCCIQILQLTIRSYNFILTIDLVNKFQMLVHLQYHNPYVENLSFIIYQILIFFQPINRLGDNLKNSCFLIIPRQCFFKKIEEEYNSKKLLPFVSLKTNFSIKLLSLNNIHFLATFHSFQALINRSVDFAFARSSNRYFAFPSQISIFIEESSTS